MMIIKKNSKKILKKWGYGKAIIEQNNEKFSVFCFIFMIFIHLLIIILFFSAFQQFFRYFFHILYLQVF